MPLKPKLIISAVALTLLFVVSGFAQSEEPGSEYGASPYDTGDQIFAIHAGGMLPLFSLDPNTGENVRLFDHLSFGASGYLEWGSYLNQSMILGIEFGGLFSKSPNRDYYMIPVTAKYTYEIRSYPLEIPLSAGIGFSITKLSDQTFFGPIAKLGAGLRFAVRGNWSLGALTQLLVVPELYFDDKADKSRIASFVEVSFSAVYHF